MSLIHAKSEVTDRKEQLRADLKTDAAENKHLVDGKEVGNKRLCGQFYVLSCNSYDSITAAPRSFPVLSMCFSI